MLHAEQDKVDVRRRDAIGREKVFRRADSEVARSLVLGCDMALGDADLLADGVRRVVRLDFFWQVRSNGADARLRPHPMSPSTPRLRRRSRMASTLV